MDNEEFNEQVTFEQVTFEPKPGFDLVKYGNVFTFNFNQEFAQRLNNVLADCHRNDLIQSQVLCFFKRLRNVMDLPNEDPGWATQFILERFQHVFTVVCEREFVKTLNQLMTQFLVQKRVSPAMFSFIKQLEGALYPKRFDPKTSYADEF
jgi:hypothetical protein